MLTREIMGIVALGVLWVNTLLIASVAFSRARQLWRFAASARRARVDGALRTLAGAACDVVAERRIERIGRAVTQPGKRRILFTDASDEQYAFACTARTKDGEEVELPDGPAELWLLERVVEEASQRSVDEEFATAYAEADRAKGLSKTFVVPLSPQGLKVWLRPGEKVLLSQIDPERWASGWAWRCALFAVAIVAAAAGCTALGLSAPVFESTLSILGGVLGLAFFLGVQPLGTAMQRAARWPSESASHTLWEEPAAG